ncbi:hypothetical protein BDF19DRAFT_411142 [Syncephalis fuscata]|nr:hypothetical protein BDF19DRAFT_411142 [Syncephalis fuscata]
MTSIVEQQPVAALPHQQRRISLPPITALQPSSLPTPSHMDNTSNFAWTTTQMASGQATVSPHTLPPPPSHVLVEDHRKRQSSLANDPFCPAPTSASSQSSNNNSPAMTAYRGHLTAGTGQSSSALSPSINMHGQSLPNTAPNTPNASATVNSFNQPSMSSLSSSSSPPLSSRSPVNYEYRPSVDNRSPSMTAGQQQLHLQPSHSTLQSHHGYASPAEESNNTMPSNMHPMQTPTRYGSHGAAPPAPLTSAHGAMAAYQRATPSNQRNLSAPDVFSPDTSGHRAAEALVALGHNRTRSVSDSDMNDSAHGPYSPSVQQQQHHSGPLSLYEAEQRWSTAASNARILTEYTAQNGERLMAAHHRGYETVQVNHDDISGINGMLQRAHAIITSLTTLRTDMCRRIDSRARKRIKRPAPPPPGRCRACNAAETPEWRRGPDGARTLCNACGLHYAKMSKKRAAAANNTNNNNNNNNNNNITTMALLMPTLL